MNTFTVLEPSPAEQEIARQERAKALVELVDLGLKLKQVKSRFAGVRDELEQATREFELACRKHLGVGIHTEDQWQNRER